MQDGNNLNGEFYNNTWNRKSLPQHRPRFQPLKGSLDSRPYPVCCRRGQKMRVGPKTSWERCEYCSTPIIKKEE